MMDAQLDTHDIQARISMKYILDNVNMGLESAMNLTQKSAADRVRMRAMIKTSLSYFEKWDFNFNLD